MDLLLLMWLAIAGGALLLELGNPGFFFFLSLSIGSGVTIAASVVGFDPMAQMALFAVVSLVAFFLFRHWVMAPKGQGPNYRTNVDALVGRRGAVTEAIRYPEAGLVKLHGETWSARAVYAEKLEKGASVEVVAVVGCHLMVKKNEV